MGEQVRKKYLTARTRCSDVFDCNGYMEISVHDKIRLETADIIELSQVLSRHSMPFHGLLILFNGSFSTSKSTCDYYFNNQLECITKKHAIVIPNLIGRTLATIRFYFKRKEFKCRIFKTKKNALIWLNNSRKSRSKELVSLKIPSQIQSA